MLFNSFIFLLVFLPIVLVLFYTARKWISARFSIGVLVASSFVFYGYWEPAYLLLLLLSILVNYAIGQRLSNGQGSHQIRRTALILGLCLNLSLLGYFKYTGFLIDNLNTFFGLSVHAQGIILPLAISFYTFQQVAYLVDCYRQEAMERDFLSYCLFVSFFPQLIAGPIVHHKEMMPQFARMDVNLEWGKNMRVGTTLFIFGLFKKTVLADNFATYANRLFDNVGTASIHMSDAWVASLSYYFQIYFDFSGYSDMAIGLAFMFGIALPINFNSPYKSRSIIEFWRRWHMTLSRFLRDYLYISLGGNRRGKSRRYLNLFITMLLGGLWHGAAWTFITWGALHGSYLMVNHAWAGILKKLGMTKVTNNGIYIAASILCTNFAVLIAWVYFRSTDVETANRIISAMFGFGEGRFSWSYRQFIVDNGFGAFFSLWLGKPLGGLTLALLFPASFFLVLKMPNTGQLMNIIEYKGRFKWAPTWLWAGCSALMLSCGFMSLFGSTEFIYFQF